MASTASNQYPQAMNFEDLYRDHLQTVKSVVKSFKFQDAAADDLVQDIFVKAWQSMHQLKVTEAFSGWLCTIAKNKCLNEVRRSRREIPTDMSNNQSFAFATLLEATDPLQSIEIEVSLQCLETLISTHQDEVRRKIAILFYLEHKSVKEISCCLNMNSNTVLSHLRRFRLVVKQAMLIWMEERQQAPTYTSKNSGVINFDS